MKKLVIVPTYNEIENIESIIRAVFTLSHPFHILIVDDNSPDGTAEKVVELQKEFQDKLHLSVRKKKSGLGTAYVHGFKWALARDYDFIFEITIKGKKAEVKVDHYGKPQHSTAN